MKQLNRRIIVVTLFFFACEAEQKKLPPANLIPAPTLTAFLNEVHKAESSLLLSGIRQDSAAALFREMEKDLYKKYKLDSGRVFSSLRYYTENIEMLDSMYQKMRALPDSAVLSGQ